MTKEKLLETIANHGYNVGFGAKKNFASFDIVTKLPNWVGFFILAIGIIQLGYPEFATKEVSILLILISIAILYVGCYNSNVSDFEKEGIRSTQLFNQLRDLYYTVQTSSKTDFTIEISKMEQIMNEFYSGTISKQVFLSQWYAHFKFFYEMQIDWIDEQLKFKFFKDKFPNSLKSFILAIILIVISILSYEYIRNL